MARTKQRAYQGYIKEELEAKIQKFNAFKSGNHVSTEFDGRSIREAEVSDKYQFFDFKKFASFVIGIIANQTRIFYYNLKITRGIQEISLLVNPVHINGDLYYQNLYLLNSNDRSRSLQFNAGLLRWDSTTGVIVPVTNASVSRKAVHRGYVFNEKVNNIEEFVKGLPELVAEQIKIVKDLSDKEVSLKSIINTIINERPEGSVEIMTSAINRAKTFVHKMFTSKDALDRVELELTDADISLFKNPLDFVKSKQDLTVNLYKAFLWYTDIYKNRDSAIIKKETSRFFELKDKFEVVEKAKTEEKEVA